MPAQNAKGRMAKMDANAIITIINETEFHNEILQHTQPVVVEFGADWSGACHIMAPMIEELAKAFRCQIKFCKIDVDDCELIAKQYGVRELPTYLFFKDGEIRDHIVGAIPRRALAVKLDALLHTQ